MDISFFDPNYFSLLDADPAIDIYQCPRNGYGHITINCQKYPLNITSLRRAFAFAFNKTKVINEHLNGYGVLHDSLVPLPNPWCIEEDLKPHYYDADSDIGNTLLDAAGFSIDPETGYRLAPNGSEFSIKIDYNPTGSLAEAVCQIAVDALSTLHINAYRNAKNVNDYITILNEHGNYDMVFYGDNYYGTDVRWLAYDYCSEFANVPYENPTNFVNETYDSYKNQLLYGTTYEEVYEAAAEMQQILHYNVPLLVVYENIYSQAYRNDRFTGHVEDLLQYITNPWTMRKIHKINGTYGGTVNIALDEDPDSLNFFTTSSKFSEAIISELWPSLYRYITNGAFHPDLAESMLIETHADNPAVPENHTRFTIDIIQNATWSDGTPLTAMDVSFTLSYQLESAAYGNPAASTLEGLSAVYAPNAQRVILEFRTESYWNFEKFAFDYIIPRHIFNNATGIGYEQWESWNPVFDPEAPNVNCGPFVFNDYEANKFYSLLRNPSFYYRVEFPPNTVTTTTSTTTGA